MLWFQVSKVQKKFDVCLSFSDGDEGLVGQICSDLLKLHTNMVIHKEQLIYNHEEVWQEKIFDVMVHSHKLVYLSLLLFSFYFCHVVYNGGEVGEEGRRLLMKLTSHLVLAG